MPDPFPPPFTRALGDLSAWLRAANAPAALIGGAAVSLLSRPRLTRDVDVLVWLPEERWAEFAAAGGTFGFRLRLRDGLDFARRARVLLMRHEPTALDADIVLGALPFEQEVTARARWTRVGGVETPLPTPEDLLILKATAGRPRDWDDAEALLDAHPKMDHRRVRRWVKLFAEALEKPEIEQRLEALRPRKSKG